MRAARSDGGVVVEVVDLEDGIDLADAFHPDLGFRTCPEDVVPGWTFDGEGFAAPPAPAFDLAAARQAMQGAVNARRDAVIAAGFQHNFGAAAGIRTLDQRSEADAINWLGLKGVADAMIADGRGADPIGIRDAHDDTFSSSASVVSSAMVAMGVWRSSIIAHSWSLKDAIAAAEDEAALDAVDIEAGWPQ